MRVLITGGAGMVGKATTERLLQSGWDVRILDIKRRFKFPGAEYARCDILDYDSLTKQMHGCDAVIHLAVVSPYVTPATRLFHINVSGTFNVFEAAAAAGIKRVVQASSINALGGFYSLSDMQIRYFPIDEDHPSYVDDPYSYGKLAAEDIGGYYWQREGISSAALRFPWVYPRGYIVTDGYLQLRERVRLMLDELIRQSDEERAARLAEARKRALDFRKQRPFEFNPDRATAAKKTIPDDLLFRTYAYNRYNLWTFLDERDAAQALEKAVTAEYNGDHVVYINDDYNSLAYASKPLAHLFFPEVTDFKTDLPGSSALISIEKARALIGFEPQHSIHKIGIS